MVTVDVGEIVRFIFVIIGIVAAVAITAGVWAILVQWAISATEDKRDLKKKPKIRKRYTQPVAPTKHGKHYNKETTDE